MTHSNRVIWILFVLGLITVFTQNEAAAQSSILVVTSTANSTTSGGCDADCSLLDAINQSEGTVGVETIQFNIGGTGPFTILTPQTNTCINSGYSITKSVIIDGTTQPGYVGKPLIQITPCQASVSNGFFVDTFSSYDSTLSVTIRGLAISGFTGGPGIALDNGQGHLIEKNFIGVDVTGNSAQANDTGIYMRSRNNIIRNNVISGNNNSGIVMVNNSDRLSINNQIVGNFIGTNFNGTAAIPNRDGIQITSGANNNTIGGTTAADRNIISGNTQWGIYTDGRDDIPAYNSNTTTIQGNFIGTNASGTGALGNGSGGIYIQRSDNNVIGGTSGTTPDGSCTGACNLISGNNVGLNIIGDELGTAEGNQVKGNFIGTTVTGLAGLGNTSGGIDLASSTNTVGGVTAAARNVISGNDGNGIRLIGDNTFGNVITGNYVGTDTTGLSDVGNGGYGVLISSGAYGNQIGDGTDQGANWIGFNGALNNGAGIGVDDTLSNGFIAEQNLISGNSIFYNTGLGIDLLPVGVTANDAGDVDDGPNGLQNAPVLTSIVAQATTTINGTLNSAPSHDYIVELFTSTDCDTSGRGEGEFFLGSVAVTTNGSGNATFQKVIPSPIDPNGAITATAIDNDATVNSVTLWNTSEFSPCIGTQTDLSLSKVDSVDPVLPGGSLSYTLTVTNPQNGSYANSVEVVDTLPAGLTYVSATPSQGNCSYDTPTRKVTCNIGQLPNNAAATITLATTVNLSVSTTSLSNTAVVSSTTPDPTPGNNTATQTTRVANANLRVTITDTPDPVAADALLTYGVVVTNLGVDTATTVALSDTLPANISLISFVATQGSCTLNGSTINCGLGTLNSGASATLTVLVRPNYHAQNTTISSTASVTALQVDPVSANNTATASTRVTVSSGMPALYFFTTATPTLTWNAVSWAIGYEVMVDDTSGFTSPNFDKNDVPASTLAVTTTVLPDGMWYWRVRAKNPDGTWGGWSAPASFMIDTP